MISRIWSDFVFVQFATPRESLAIYRTVLALWLLTFSVPQFQWIAGYPRVFLDPPLGLTSFFFTDFPPPFVFVALDGVSIVALVYLLAGRYVLSAAVTYTVCQIIGQGWAYSFGKINHELLLVLTPLFVALAERESRTTKTGWPLALFAFTISIAMFTAAVAKLATGWLDPSVSATLGHGVGNALGAAGRDNAAWQLAIGVLPLPAWKAMDLVAVAMEASFVFTVYWRRTFLVSISLACLFHLGVATLMSILFVNVFAYAAFVPWVSVLSSLGLMSTWTRLEHLLRRQSSSRIALAATAIAAAYLVWRNPLSFAWESITGINAALIATAIAAFAGALYLVTFAVSLIRSPSSRPPRPILFDGVCGLCNFWVDFVLWSDRDGRFCFVPLQSETGQRLLSGRGLSSDYTASIVLIDGEHVHLRSSAILEILAGLGGLWRFAVIGRIVPNKIRDWAYDIVAENRYKWFGRRDVCRLPTAAERSRFLQ